MNTLLITADRVIAGPADRVTADGAVLVDESTGALSAVGPAAELDATVDVFAYARAEGIELRLDATEIQVRRPPADRGGRRAFISSKKKQNTKPPLALPRPHHRRTRPGRSQTLEATDALDPPPRPPARHLPSHRRHRLRPHLQHLKTGHPGRTCPTRYHAPARWRTS
ncbi:hypothetical protein [Streptomyces sp. NPDC093598]|uniref:hypothetical protein n=1 Tax=Streptomyces sp. NPDC093598 TaxID=3366046 RepID=UPI00381B12BE